MKKAATRRSSDRISQTRDGATRRERISIFISYASEDNKLANDIERLIKRTFPLAPLSTFLDIENIRPGDNYAEVIDQALDDADILLLLLTGRRKISHSYTGYEVGYFNNAVKNRPLGCADLPRIMIPFCIGAVNPDMLHFIQGVSIDASTVSGFQFDSDHSDDCRDVTSSPAFKFLKAIYDKLKIVLGPEHELSADQFRSEVLCTAAKDLIGIVNRYSQNLISSVVYPERKIIVTLDQCPPIRKEGADLSGAMIELIGDFSTMLGISNSDPTGVRFSWETFGTKMPVEVRGKVVSAIEHLSGAALSKIGDNYHVISSESGTASFRLFVSKIVTFVNQRTEIDIYAVNMITREYGDELTTRLLRLASVGLRFRFLVVENQSKFTPEKLGFPSVSLDVLRQSILEMQSEMSLILRKAEQARINDPGLLIQVWGTSDNAKVLNMMQTWEISRRDLNAASDEILNFVDGEDFISKKSNFISALTRFRGNVNEMNRDFTSRVLKLLQREVAKRLGDEFAD